MFTSLPTMSEFTRATKSSSDRSMSSTPGAELAGEVEAQRLRRQAFEVAARGDERAARLRHLGAVDGEEAMHEHRGRLAAARAVQHRRPEQVVEVADVLADEVIQLGLAVGAQVFVVVQPAFVAQRLEAAEIADGRIEPHVEIFSGRTGNLETEVGRVARDVPILQARLEPLGEFGAHFGLARAAAFQPFAQHVGEIAELEEVVLGLAQHRRRAADGRDRIDQLVGRVGRRRSFRRSRRTGRPCGKPGIRPSRTDRAGTCRPSRRRPGARCAW